MTGSPGLFPHKCHDTIALPPPTYFCLYSFPSSPDQLIVLFTCYDKTGPRYRANSTGLNYVRRRVTHFLFQRRNVPRWRHFSSPRSTPSSRSPTTLFFLLYIQHIVNALLVPALVAPATNCILSLFISPNASSMQSSYTRDELQRRTLYSSISRGLRASTRHPSPQPPLVLLYCASTIRFRET